MESKLPARVRQALSRIVVAGRAANAIALTHPCAAANIDRPSDGTPTGVPAPILAKLNHDIVAVVRSPELRDRLAADGGEAIGSSAEEFARHIRAEIATWAKVVKAAGVRAE
jgi:hypothetical protein